MTDIHRVIVTASRTWGEPDIIRAALGHAERGRPPDTMLLVHGACDPRDPIEPTIIIPWATAARYPWDDRMVLLSGDWHAHNHAVRMGWRTEPHPVHPREWRALGKGAGPARNKIMVKTGAEQGHAALQAGLPNEGTLGCAILMARAGIPVTFWCDGCGPAPLPEPCARHALRHVRARWFCEAGEVTQGDTLLF